MFSDLEGSMDKGSFTQGRKYSQLSSTLDQNGYLAKKNKYSNQISTI